MFCIKSIHPLYVFLSNLGRRSCILLNYFANWCKLWVTDCIHLFCCVFASIVQNIKLYLLLTLQCLKKIGMPPNIQIKFVSWELFLNIPQPEPFFLTFALYDAREGRKISEDFHIDPNEMEIRAMIPVELLSPSERHSAGGKDLAAPDTSGLRSDWLFQSQRQVSCWLLFS